MTIFDRVHWRIVDQRVSPFRKAVTWIVLAAFYVLLPWFVPVGLVGAPVWRVFALYSPASLTGPAILFGAILLGYGVVLPMVIKPDWVLIRAGLGIGALCATAVAGYLCSWYVFSEGNLLACSFEALFWLIGALGCPMLVGLGINHASVGCGP